MPCPCLTSSAWPDILPALLRPACSPLCIGAGAGAGPEGWRGHTNNVTSCNDQQAPPRFPHIDAVLQGGGCGTSNVATIHCVTP
ncbi:hypothetical protein BDZ91DRAFT_47149 [Kalaharituber pfeilii]|nr:hypothetical protein BDZ91DRAFT_47149 [Kalaharituber pfeilii]